MRGGQNPPGRQATDTRGVKGGPPGDALVTAAVDLSTHGATAIKLKRRVAVGRTAGRLGTVRRASGESRVDCPYLAMVALAVFWLARVGKRAKDQDVSSYRTGNLQAVEWKNNKGG